MNDLNLSLKNGNNTADLSLSKSAYPNHAVFLMIWNRSKTHSDPAFHLTKEEAIKIRDALTDLIERS